MANIPLDTQGKRPAFFSDPSLDAMMTALLEVMAENWTLKERLYALEKTLKTQGVLAENSLEDVTWSDSEKMEHESERQRFLTDAFRALNTRFVNRAERQTEIDR